ncbi:MAG: oligosaccharide flippase family protein [Thermoplasmatota archaeon]
MNLKKVIGDMGVIGISEIIISSRGIILLPILTRYLGAEGYGLWVQAMATFSVVLPLMVMGLPYSMTRIFASRENIEEISKDFFSISFIVFLTSLIVSGVLLLFPQFLADAIFEGKTLIVRIVAVTLFVYSTSNLMINVFRAFREMKKFSVLNVSWKLGEIALAALLVVLGYGLIGALLGLLIVRSILFLVLISLMLRKFTFSLPDISRTKEYLSFGVPTIPSNLSHWIVSSSDRFLIGIFLSATYVGYYNPGYSIGHLVPFLIVGVFGLVLPPTLSEYYEQGEISDLEQVLSLSLKYFFIISIPFSFGILLLNEPILLFLTGDAQIASEGGIIAVYTAFTGLIYGVGMLLSQILVLKKKTKIIGLKWTIAAVVNIGANIILIPILGIIGAAITTIAAYSIATVVTIYFSLITEEDISLNFDLSSYSKIIISSILMGLFIYLIREQVWRNLFFLIISGIIVYFSIMFLIGGIKKEEIRFIKSMV